MFFIKVFQKQRRVVRNFYFISIESKLFTESSFFLNLMFINFVFLPTTFAQL